MYGFPEEILMSKKTPRTNNFVCNESISHVMRVMRKSKKTWAIVRDSMIEWGLNPECDFRPLFLQRGLNNINLKPRARYPYYLVINGVFVGFRRGKDGERIYYKKENFTSSWLIDAFYEVGKLINNGILSRNDIYGREIDKSYIISYVEEDSVVRKKRLNEKKNQSQENCRHLKIGLDEYDLWASRIGHLDKHKCGKPFKCSGCGLDFGINEGWRIDYTDFCFCRNCMKLIIERLGPKPRLGRGASPFIYTPMGNKR